MQKYCERRRYDFAFLTPSYDREGHLVVLNGIRDALEKYSTVFAIGADVVIMNHNICVNEDFDYAPLTIAREHLSWFPINNDVCIWRQCPQSFDLLNKIIADIDTWMRYKWMWQTALWNMIQTIPWVKASVQIVEARRMGSTLQQTLSAWQIGDFLVHLLDMPMEKRIELSKQLIPMSGDPILLQ